MKDRILFKVKLKINNLNEYPPIDRPCAGVYCTELIIDKTNNNNIQLKVFFDDNEYLDTKILHWSQKNDSNLLKEFEVIEIIHPNKLIEINFLNYFYKGIKSDSSFYEEGFKFFIINLTGIRITYKNTEKGKSQFYLNQQAFKLIEANYHYHNHFPWTEKNYKWEPQNEITDYINFNEIKFKPEHNFYILNDTREQQVILKKEPKISIAYSGAPEVVIKRHIKLLCSLYSFYANSRIEYSFSKIYTENKLYIEIKDIEDFSLKSEHGLFRWEFFQNPLNLIHNVDIPHLIKNVNFVLQIIERYNYALATTEESKFMILYNILEQIRNEYILGKKIEQDKAGEDPNINKVFEEYEFLTSKKQTDKILKETLEKLIDIIADKHKEQFKKDIQFKLTPIKVFSMVDQFHSLFTYIEINPEDYGLNFGKLKRLRDSIFHGRPIRESKQELDEINKYKSLPKFVGVVLLKYFGINNISKIERIDRIN